MGMTVSGKIYFIVSRFAIEEAYLAFVQGETAYDLIFGFLNFLLSLMELRLGGSPLLESGILFLSCRVKVDSWYLKFDK